MRTAGKYGGLLAGIAIASLCSGGEPDPAISASVPLSETEYAVVPEREIVISHPEFSLSARDATRPHWTGGAPKDSFPLLAQASVRSGSDSWKLREGPSVALAESDASFGKDLTAVFRPSRWRRPLAVGGALSWLNPRAWSRDPYRTTAVLAGEAVFAFAVYYAVDAMDDGGRRSRSEPEETLAPTRRASGGGTTDGSSNGGGSESASPPPPRTGGSDETTG